jgi:hypothetical protein
VKKLAYKALQTDKGKQSCLLHSQKPRQLTFAAELGRYPTENTRTNVNSMKQSFYVLFVTGAFAIAATFLAWVWGGKQEDVGSALGGVIGFLLANGVALTFRGPGISGKSQNEKAPESASFELGFAYGVFAIIYFAFVGWLAGYLHDHGELAGAVCGGLGGYILAAR